MLALLLNQPVFVVCKFKVVSPRTLTYTHMPSLVPTILDITYEKLQGPNISDRRDGVFCIP